MADQATLLQPVPPIGKKTSSSNSTRIEAKGEATAGTEMQPDAEVSMSTFQAATYGSFVLTFILAGFAAVVLFRKALDTTERRFSKSAKALAGVMIFMSMHGFFAASTYTNYLREDSDTAPVSLTLLFWIILGVTIGYLTNRLLEVKDKLKMMGAAIDALFYAAIFIFITLAVSPEINPNASLILSLIALVLYTVPLARFFIAYKSVKFRHRELQSKSNKGLLYSLAIIPAFLPIVALLYTFKAFGPDTSLLCINLISSSFVLLVSVYMLASMKSSKSEQASEAATAATTATAATAAPKNDPLVEELLAEEAAAKIKAETEHKAVPSYKIEPVAEIAPEKAVRPNVPKKPPSRQKNSADKGSGRLKAPKKPDQINKGSHKTAPNSPSKIKAPAKPKKRF
jgi:hypothetical protein